MPPPGPDPHDAARMLEQTNADPMALDSLRAAYAGRHDVLDALWWAAHPLTESPGGSPDPALGFSELQRAAFSRSALDSPLVDVDDPVSGRRTRMRESEWQLRQAERVLDEDAGHLSAALHAVTPVVPSDEPLPPPFASLDSGVSAGARPTTPAETPESTHRATGMSRKLLVLIIVPVAAVLAFAFLWPGIPGVTLMANEAPKPDPTRTPYQEVTAVTTQGEFAGPAPLEILEQPARDIDAVPVELAGALGQESFRFLGSPLEHVKIYVSRGHEQSVCFSMGYSDGWAMSCSQESELLAHPVQLDSTQGVFPLPSGGTVKILSETFSVSLDGTISFISVSEQPVMFAG